MRQREGKSRSLLAGPWRSADASPIPCRGLGVLSGLSVAALQYTGQPFLCLGAQSGFCTVRGPGNLQCRSRGPVYVTNLPPGVKRRQDHYKYVPLMVPLIGHALRQTNLGTMALGSKGFHPTAHRSFFITGGCCIMGFIGKTEFVTY